MGSVLQQSQITQVIEQFEQSFHFQNQVVYFPIRHHSPACAWYLKQTIQEYQPEIILVEGPSDAQHLIPYIGSSQAQPPFCIYCSYDDCDKYISEEAQRYRAYYPFLAYSPELIAIQCAQQNKIPVQLIDLPYGGYLINQKSEAEVQYHYGKDQIYEVNQYTASLAQKMGCRSFAEFWEAQYELNIGKKPLKEFVKSVFALAYFMRKTTPEDTSENWIHRVREQYMRDNISQAMKQYQRILVVTGAFHTIALLHSLDNPLPIKPHQSKAAACYLMPYSFPEMDSRSGYEAGVLYPAYYQQIWNRLLKKQTGIYLQTALHLIIKTAHYARKTQIVSIPDQINSYQMVQMLAQLRNKSNPGVYELIDGVRSSFVKGDINSTATFELDFLLKLLTGMGVGSISIGDCIPPVVLEFRALCAKFRLRTSSIERQQVTLDIVKNPAHYEKSRFLHQLLFLETGFCKLESGPDYVNGTDKNLVREQWTCHYSIQIETKLIDLSVYGASIVQVCSSLIQQKFEKLIQISELGKLLTMVQILGVEQFYWDYQDAILDAVGKEQNFNQLCSLVNQLRYLVGMQKMVHQEAHPFILQLLSKSFYQACQQILLVKQATPEEEQQVCIDLNQLFAFSLEDPQLCDRAFFQQQIAAVLENSFCNSRFYGTSLAIHYQQGCIDVTLFSEQILNYLQTAIQNPEQAASFVCGIFLAGRDILFSDVRVLEQLDQVIASMNDEEFLTVLPNLRYAFTSFLPAEIKRVGTMVAQYHQLDENVSDFDGAVTQRQIEQGIRVDSFVTKQLKNWGWLSDDK